MVCDEALKTALAAMCSRLDQSPEDWQLRLVYADALEEDGGESFAHYYRWTALEGVHPIKDGVYLVGWNYVAWGGTASTAPWSWMHPEADEWEGYAATGWESREVCERSAAAFFRDYGYPVSHGGARNGEAVLFQGGGAR